MKTQWSRLFLFMAVIGIQLCPVYVVSCLLLGEVKNSCTAAEVVLLFYFTALIVNGFLNYWLKNSFYRYLINFTVWTICIYATVNVQIAGTPILMISDLYGYLPEYIEKAPDGMIMLLLIISIGSVCWGLGFRTVIIHVDYLLFIKDFQFGFIILLISLLIDSIMGNPQPSFFPVIFVFFTFALTGMSLAHGLEGKGWLSGNAKMQWFGFVIISVLFVMLFGLLIGMIAKPEIINMILSIFTAIWKLILKILGFISGFFPDPEPLEMPITDTPIPDIKESYSKPSEIMNTVRRIVGYFVIGFWILFFIIVMRSISSQFFGWLRNRMGSSGGVVIKPVQGAFWADIVSICRYLWNKAAGVYRLIHIRFLFLFNKGGRGPVSYSIQKTYEKLIKMASAEGFNRLIFQTPYDYLNELVKWSPSLRGELSFITRQYVIFRYSASLPNEFILRSIGKSWRRIRKSQTEKDSKNI